MMNGKHTFFDLDIGKSFAGLAFPGLDMESLIAAQRKNLEALTQANQLAIEGVQTLARRQVELARRAFEEASAAISDWTRPGAPEERFAQQAELVKQAFERGVVQARELTELVAKANAEAFDVLNKRVAEGLEEVRDLAKPRVAR